MPRPDCAGCSPGTLSDPTACRACACWRTRCASVSSETRWGVWLHAVRPVPRLAELAEAAEGLGAAAILVADEGTDRDLYVTLAALAQRTHSALLMAAVTNPY